MTAAGLNQLVSVPCHKIKFCHLNDLVIVACASTSGIGPEGSQDCRLGGQARAPCPCTVTCAGFGFRQGYMCPSSPRQHACRRLVVCSQGVGGQAHTHASKRQSTGRKCPPFPPERCFPHLQALFSPLPCNEQNVDPRQTARSHRAAGVSHGWGGEGPIHL